MTLRTAFQALLYAQAAALGRSVPKDELPSADKDVVEINLEDVWHVILFLDHLQCMVKFFFCANLRTSFGLIRFISFLYYAS